MRQKSIFPVVVLLPLAFALTANGCTAGGFARGEFGDFPVGTKLESFARRALSDFHLLFSILTSTTLLLCALAFFPIELILSSARFPKAYESDANTAVSLVGHWRNWL